jgi:hypothetical protein
MAKKVVPMTDAEREARWQAEDDARVLKRAMEIEKDKQRKKNAQSVITEELKTLQNLVGVKKAPTKTPPKKTPTKKATGKKK